MEKERLYFSETNACPVKIETKAGARIAYLFNLSVGGMCFVVPKQSYAYDGKMGVHQMGEEVKIAMAPLRAGRLNCQLKVVHAREDADFHYYGGEFVNLDPQQQEKIAGELAGVKMRQPIKKAPVFGALWLTAAVLFFVALTTA